MARKKQTKAYKKERINEAKKLVRDNFGQDVFDVIRKKYAAYRGKSGIQTKVYKFLFEAGFSYREIAKLTGKTHEAIRHAIIASDLKSSPVGQDQATVAQITKDKSLVEAIPNEKELLKNLPPIEARERVRVVDIEKEEPHLVSVAKAISNIDKTLYGSVFPSLHKAREYVIVDEEEEEIVEEGIVGDNNREVISGNDNLNKKVFSWSGTAGELRKGTPISELPDRSVGGETLGKDSAEASGLKAQTDIVQGEAVKLELKTNSQKTGVTTNQNPAVVLPDKTVIEQKKEAKTDNKKEEFAIPISLLSGKDLDKDDDAHKPVPSIATQTSVPSNNVNVVEKPPAIIEKKHFGWKIPAVLITVILLLLSMFLGQNYIKGGANISEQAKNISKRAKDLAEGSMNKVTELAGLKQPKVEEKVVDEGGDIDEKIAELKKELEASSQQQQEQLQKELDKAEQEKIKGQVGQEKTAYVIVELPDGTKEAAPIKEGEVKDGKITTQTIIQQIDSNGEVQQTVAQIELGEGSITNWHLADGSISTAEIVAAAVTGEKLADGSVTLNKIANATITGDKIKNLTITGDKIANDGSVVKSITAGDSAIDVTGGSNGAYTIGFKPSCNAGEVLKWVGGKWACGTDEGDTYTAGTGLALSGDQFSIAETYDDNFLINTTAFGGDVSGTYGAISVTDDSHSHTVATLPSHDSLTGAGTVDTTIEVQGVAVGGDASGTVGTIAVSDDSHSHTAVTLPVNTSYLGSTIDSTEIADNTILEVDLTTSNAAGNGQLLAYNSGTGGFTWVDATSVTDIWVDTAGDTMTGGLIFSGVATDITSVSNQDIVISPNGTGKVGIANGSPGYTLDVGGDINIGDANEYRIGGTQILSKGNGSLAGNLIVGDGGGSMTHSAGNEGYYNFAAGLSALNGVTSGYQNSAMGYGALYSNTTGYSNTAMGYVAQLSNLSGSANIVIGDQAGYYNQTGNSNVIIGYAAGYGVASNSYSNNTFIGYQTGALTTTGGNNFFGGYQSGYTNQTGQSNTFIGYRAGYSNTTGASNFYGGYTAGYLNTTGAGNVAIGYEAGYSNTVNNNLFIGSGAGRSNTTGANNSYLGAYTGNYNQTGSANSIVGYMAGGYGAGGANSFSNNTMLGSEAGYSTTTGGNNLVLGYQAGYGNATGAGNIFLGYQAGYSETGSNKLYIDNSNTATPLIGGDFNTNVLTVNGTLNATGSLTINDNDGVSNDANIALGDTDETGQIVFYDGSTNTGTLAVGSLGADATYTFSGATGTVWTSGNDGSGSTLDADLLDGHDTGYFMTAGTDIWVDTAGDTMTGGLIFSGVATDITSVSNQDIVISPNGTGKVGIANGSPGYTLDVGGDINIGDANEYRIGGTQILSKGNGSLAGNLIVGDGGGSMTHAAGNEGYYNTAVGMSSLLSTTIGYENTAVGRAALFSNTTGYHNTALGSSSLIANTTGYNNTAVGVSSLAFNTTGFENVATGDGALSSNTTGAANVGIGYYAGAYNQTGNSNVLIGEYAGYGAINNSYSNNTFVGYQSGYVTTTGGSNTFIGYQSGYNSQAGSNNTFLGYQSGRGNALYTNSFNNTVIGYQAGVKTTTGTNSNTFIGYQSGNNSTGGANFFGGALAGYSNTTGDNSVALGISALYSNTTGVQNTAVGSNAGYSSATGSGNVFLGYQAGYNETGSSKLYIDNSNTATPLIYGDFSTNAVTINGDLAVADAEEYFIGSTQVLSKGNGSLTGNLFVGDGGGSTTHGAGNEGWYNTSVGLNALQAVTTGYSNTAVGLNALAGDTAGYNNIGLGLNTLIANTTGANNIAIGAGPLASNVSGSANIAIGTMALDVSTTDNNLAVGANALGDDTTGTANIALGNSAGLFNVTGSNNTLLGYESGRGVSTNSYSDNTFIGYQTGYSTTTGGNNFFGGYQAGYSNASGAGNIFLGYQAGYSETGSNKLYVDNSNTASPLLYGDFSTDTLVVNGTVGINTAGPDRRFDILDTANPQLRLTQTDGSIFTDFQVMATTSDLQITTASSGDLVLTNAGTEIKIKESTGNTFYGIIDIGDLAADSTYTISGPSGNVVTTTTEANFTAAGRHARRIQLNAEYPGSLFTKFYGAGTDTSTTGSMNSDAEPAADNLRTYFEWSSSEASLNYYTVAVRITLPQDFDAWATSNAVQVDIDTESTDTANNLVSAYIYNGDDTPGTGVASDITNASASGDTWETLTIDDSAIDDGSAPDWDGAGETAVIYLRLGSKSDNFARIGDIKLNYLSKW